MKTSELIGPALNWAVVVALGIKYQIATQGYYGQIPYVPRKWIEIWSQEEVDYVEFCPSIDWAQGGPIIEREGIGFFQKKDQGYCQAAYPGAEFVRRGPTPLIAAMRCFVASRLGDEVDIPEELLT